MNKLLYRLFNFVRVHQKARLLQTCQFSLRLPAQPNIFPISMDGKAATAGVIIIGDEIIKGQVQDCNSQFLCQRLHHLGVSVKLVLTVPDDLSTIAQHVKEFSSRYTYVITSGGIGPTHDDITYDAVAAAFGVKTAINGEIEDIYKGYFKEKYTDTHRKLALVPETSELVRNKKNFPIVRINNVFVLPGVPRFFRLAFAALEELMRDPSINYKTRALYLDVDEMSIADKLTVINESFKNTVTIGSYPEWHSNYYKVKITLESTDDVVIDDCEASLRERIGSRFFVPYDADPIKDSWQGLSRLLAADNQISDRLQESVNVFREAMERYSLDEISVGFNGGKDCTALLHIW